MLVLIVVGCSAGGGGPASPTDVTVTANPGFITVSWSYSGQAVTGFTIFRDTAMTTGLTTQQLAAIGTAGATERSYEDTTAVPGTSYSYAVRADGEGGSSGLVESAAPVEAIQDPRVIDDTISNWGGGTADLVARIGFPSTAIAQGTVAADWKIALTLPATVSDELLDDLGTCDDSPTWTVTPENARFALLDEIAAEDAGLFIGHVEQLSSDGSIAVTRLYFDVATKIEGTCEGAIFQIDAPQGWSLLELELPETGPDAISYKTVTYTDVPWEFFPVF
ncbi:MAG: fibronectin type III domain-containing protein [Trueperaceae bacterium]|nr:MAG: fibronectin type III domain-containing protein [Trueperaceae bacterium]